MSQPDQISSLIITIRGQKALLDSDLATLYGVATKRFNEQVKRNLDRFPKDFMFRLTQEEFDSLRSQSATSKNQRGGRRSLPNAFTEHGALMAANILNSPRAIETSIAVVRAFLRLRTLALSVDELVNKVSSLEKKYDENFRVVFDAIRQLLEPPDPPRRKIGFHPEQEETTETKPD